jgi:tRNA (guanosine-2'-O-)-methyltransferase
MDENLTSQEYLDYLYDFITPERKSKIATVLSQRSMHFTVVVEDVFQLHNTSAVLRSCDAFGVQELHVIERKYGKNIDSEIALGAQKWVDVFRYKHPDDCIEYLKDKGYKTIVTSPHFQASTPETIDVNQPIALFFGNEKNGVSEEVLAQADGFMTIPMLGFSESLNISVAAAIAMQELSKRIRRSEIPWELTSDKALVTKIHWVEQSIRSLESVRQNFLKHRVN